MRGAPSNPTVFDAVNALTGGIASQIKGVLSPPTGPLYPGPTVPANLTKLQPQLTYDIDDKNFAAAFMAPYGPLPPSMEINLSGNFLMVDPVSDAWCFIEPVSTQYSSIAPLLASAGFKLRMPFDSIKVVWPGLQQRSTPSGGSWQMGTTGVTSLTQPSASTWADPNNVVNQVNQTTLAYRRLRLIIGTDCDVTLGPDGRDLQQKYLFTGGQNFGAGVTSGQTGIFNVGESAVVENLVVELTDSVPTATNYFPRVSVLFTDYQGNYITFGGANSLLFLKPFPLSFSTVATGLMGAQRMYFGHPKFRLPSGACGFIIAWSFFGAAGTGNVETLGASFLA